MAEMALNPMTSLLENGERSMTPDYLGMQPRNLLESPSTPTLRKPEISSSTSVEIPPKYVDESPLLKRHPQASPP
ncbi:hypothetical protein H0H93_003364, partial [Arthromyces matolae]